MPAVSVNERSMARLTALEIGGSKFRGTSIASIRETSRVLISRHEGLPKSVTKSRCEMFEAFDSIASIALCCMPPAMAIIASFTP